MSPMRWLLACTLLATAFTGCFDEGPQETPPAPEPAVEGGKGTLGYDIDPEKANDTELEGAHAHDEWGTTTEMVLMEESVATADCGGDGNPFTTLFILGVGAVTQQSVHYGCAQFQLADGKIVHEGTAWVRVEVDASDALKQGVMELAYRNPEHRFTDLEESDGPTFTWRIPVTPLEWDLPHSTVTEWGFFLQPSGQIAVLDGEISVRVVAERMPDWRPILGSAHIDHWAEDAEHDFVATDVMRILDVNATLVMESFADRIASGGGGGRGFGGDVTPLEDIIAPGATQLSLFVQWKEIRNCPAQHVCWVVPFMAAGENGRSVWLDAVEATEEWAIYVYDIPDPLNADSTYANNSTYGVGAFIRSCIPGAEDVEMPFGGFRACFGEAVATMEADTWLYAETWKSGVRLDELKARVGVA